MKIFETFDNINKLKDKLDSIDTKKLDDSIKTLVSNNENIYNEIDELKNEVKLLKEELNLTLLDIVKISSLIKTHQEAIMKLFEAYAKLLLKKSEPDEVDQLLNDKPKKNNNNLN